MTTAKVLVTGASGFLASHVVQQLQAAGHVVRGTVRSRKNQDKIQHLYNLCPGAAHPLELLEADLLEPEGWEPAVKGMDYVIHTASPVPLFAPKRDEDVIQPAVEGTLAVLRACAKVRSVKRVVLTSSAAAVDYGRKETKIQQAVTEADWTDPKSKTMSAYTRSKTLAEQAAWHFMKELTDSDNKFELAVINPTVIVGPPLQGSSCASVELITMLLKHELPRIPRVHLGFNDVSDCAAAHVRAMTVPEAAGNRHIIDTESFWVEEIAVLLKTVFQPQGYNVPTSPMPNFLMWLGSWFDKGTKQLYYELDMEHRYDVTRMREVLGIQTDKDMRDSIIEMAYALIEAGFVKKTKQYRGPGGAEERQRYMDVKLS